MKFIELLFQVTVAIFLVLIVDTEAEGEGCNPMNGNKECNVTTEFCYDPSIAQDNGVCKILINKDEACTDTDRCKSGLSCSKSSNTCVVTPKPSGNKGGKLGGGKKNEEEGGKFPGILTALLNALKSVRNKFFYNRG